LRAAFIGAAVLLLLLPQALQAPFIYLRF